MPAWPPAERPRVVAGGGPRFSMVLRGLRVDARHRPSGQGALAATIQGACQAGVVAALPGHGANASETVGEASTAGAPGRSRL